MDKPGCAVVDLDVDVQVSRLITSEILKNR
jgi:hypothetical protein